MSAGGPDLPLTVDLQEGFSGDEVTIRVGGAEVFRRPDVRTRMQTGRADGWSGPVRPGFVRLEVDVAERRASGRLEFRVERPMFVGVKYAPEDGFSFAIQDFPFRYM